MNSRRSADPQLSGSTYAVMKGGSRFAMCDDYPLFRKYLVPILDRIRG